MQPGCKGCKKVAKVATLSGFLSCVIGNRGAGNAWQAWQQRNKKKEQLMTYKNPRSPILYNTRKVIRQKVANRLQRLPHCQDSFLVLYVKRLQICNLCNLLATHLQPFKKYVNKPKTLIPCGFTACIFTFATFATYFRGSLYIEKTFFIFYFSTQPLKTGCKGCK